MMSNFHPTIRVAIRIKGMKDSDLKKGDKVEWNSTQGTIKGTVEKKITGPMKIKTHEVKASPDDPQILVKSAKTGAKAAHNPAALKKTN